MENTNSLPDASHLPDKVTSKSPMMLTSREVDYKMDRVNGMTAERAFEKNFRNDPDWEEFFLTLPEKPHDRKIRIRWAARELDQRKEMGELQTIINKRVSSLANVALDTMEQIMIESKSDKTRADVAIELLRQNIGSPDKQEQANTNIKIVFGSEKPIIDGEIIDDDRF